MLKKKQWILVLFAVIVLSVASIFIYSQFIKTPTKPQNSRTAQVQNFPKNSPEEVTQDYYLSYESCLSKNINDLKKINIQKDCPIHEFTGMAKVFVQENQVTYEDQILCDEGIPLKMNIGKAYIGDDHVATVNVIINSKYDQFVIPVRLQKENGAWKIFRVDCDLDGSLE